MDESYAVLGIRSRNKKRGFDPAQRHDYAMYLCMYVWFFKCEGYSHRSGYCLDHRCRNVNSRQGLIQSGKGQSLFRLKLYVNKSFY